MEARSLPVCGGASGKEERFVQGFFYRCESNKKESSKKFSFRRIDLKIENYNYFHSTGVHKEEALSISHFKTVSPFTAI